MSLSALFLSHGSPMMVLEDTPARRFIAGLRAVLSRPRAVLAVSAHWTSPVPAVGLAARPAKIDDMTGFPAELYRMTYAPPGDPELAEAAAALLGPETRRDAGRGIDHGIWSVMSLIWPEADVPVIPVAVQPDAGAAHHYRLGQALRPLLDTGVLLLGTGAATHNLGAYFRRRPGAPDDAATLDFTDWLAAAVERGDTEALLDYRARAPHATFAHPTDEHLLPLFAALGAGSEPGQRLHHSLDAGILAMDCYGWT